MQQYILREQKVQESKTFHFPWDSSNPDPG